MGMGEKSWYLNRENFCKELIMKSIFEDDFFFALLWHELLCPTFYLYLVLFFHHCILILCVWILSVVLFFHHFIHLACMILSGVLFSPLYPHLVCMYDVVLFYWFCKEFSFFLWELLTLIIHISIIWHKFQMFFL